MKNCILLIILFVINISLSAQETNTSYYARLQKGENKEIISELSVKIAAEPNEELLFILGEAYKNQFDYINALNSYLKILTLKYELNLFNKPVTNLADYPDFGSEKFARAFSEFDKSNVDKIKASLLGL